MTRALATLADEHDSPLLQLFTILDTNVTPGVREKSPELAALLTFLRVDAKQAPSPKTLISALHQLERDLFTVVGDPQPTQAAFELANRRFRGDGRQDAFSALEAQIPLYPEPIRGWLNSLVTNAWQLVLFQAQNHIEAAWQKIIVPQYDAQLHNRFPFNPQANESVSLENFRYFYAPEGLVDKFFAEYLAPFIDEKTGQSKSVDGGGLELSPDLLAYLKTVRTIQTQYFSKIYHRLAVPFKLQFTRPSRNLSRAVIQLGNQKISYQPHHALPDSVLVWPDNTHDTSASVTFYHADGSTSTQLHEAGPWGWLRLMQAAQLKEDSHHERTYHGVFEYKKDRLHVSLLLNDEPNPFDLALFEHMKFPREI